MEQKELELMFSQQSENEKQHNERYKKEFFRRKAKFPYKENVENEKHLRKGDEVIVLNGFGIPVGPFEVLGFRDENEFWLSWDCYWVSKPVSSVVAVKQN